MNKKQEAQVRRDNRDKLVQSQVDKGWQILPRVANQADTVRLLRATAKRLNVRIDLNSWPNGETVTYRVMSIEDDEK